MEIKEVDGVFNPSSYGIIYSADPEEADLLDEEKKKAEDSLYQEVIHGLKTDLTDLGIKIAYSTNILIGEVAMNIILLNRVKSAILCKDLLRDETILRKSYVSDKIMPNVSKSKSLSYDIFFGGQEIHPLFDRLIPKLQRQINEGLRLLGLLPSQQLERQKVVIIEKLRKRLMEINTPTEEYTADVLVKVKK